MIEIPDRLKNPDYRFYLVIHGAKLPAEKGWVDNANYLFNEPHLTQHSGNYGIACGHGGLIVLDFDDRATYDLVKDKLPQTFTVLSATKRMPHLYYILKGEMIRKMSLRDAEDNTLLDIQAARAGVVGPNSRVGSNTYDVVNDIPLATVPLELLEGVLGFRANRHREFSTQTRTDAPIQTVIEVGRALRDAGVVQVSPSHFKCPFHKMNGAGNLTLFGTKPSLYCFHEQRYWKSIEEFLIDLSAARGRR